MLRVLHLISGGDTGGAKTHVLSLIKQLQKSLDIKIICFMEGEFFDEAKAMGINIEVIKQKSRFDLKVVSKICEIIKAEGYNIVHSHGARANFITSYVRKKAKIPCVTTIHSDYLYDFKGNTYKYLVFTTLNKIALNKFDYYIAVSDDFKQMLRGRGFPQEKIFTVYNGVDFNHQVAYMQRLEYLQSVGLEYLNDNLLVGIIARMHPVKGHRVLVEAAAEVLKIHRNIHFLFAGDGEERKNLEVLSESLGIRENMHFLGFVDNSYSFLNVIDINTLVSFTESFPYALLEGAMLSKASIASAVGGIPKLIQDGVTGYLFKAGDSKVLAQKLLSLVENAEIREKFGKALYSHAKNNYSLENLGNEHIKIYNRILGR